MISVYSNFESEKMLNRTGFVHFILILIKGLKFLLKYACKS